MQANVKMREGPQHPDRDAQFRYLNRQVKSFRRTGDPVISVDTKKKELVGAFKNGGRRWMPQGAPDKVSAYDFPSQAEGKAIPSGAYDIARNRAVVNVGVKRGKVYLQHDPGVLVRIKGQAPIDATVYELERLRCNLCGKVFTFEAPEGVGEQKYDASAASMIALLRYGSGFPWNRLERLQDSLGIPLPAATQCEIVAEKAAALQPAYEELIRQAAQGECYITTTLPCVCWH